MSHTYLLLVSGRDKWNKRMIAKVFRNVGHSLVTYRVEVTKGKKFIIFNSEKCVCVVCRQDHWVSLQTDMQPYKENWNSQKVHAQIKTCTRPMISSWLCDCLIFNKNTSKTITHGMHAIKKINSLNIRRLLAPLKSSQKKGSGTKQ